MQIKLVESEVETEKDENTPNVTNLIYIDNSLNIARATSAAPRGRDNFYSVGGGFIAGYIKISFYKLNESQFL